MIYKSDLLQAESFIRRIIAEEQDSHSCHPKIFDCPVCEHRTLSETIQIKTDDRFKSSRYCFNCGNSFLKKTEWQKIEEE